MAAMKGKGDPEEDLSILKLTKTWLGLVSVLSLEKNVACYVFISQVSSTSCDGITSIQSLPLGKPVMALTGGQATQRGRVLDSWDSLTALSFSLT